MTELPIKRDVANQLLRKGSLFIHLDPRVSDVVVPPWLRHQAQLVLQVGLDMPIPIPDLRVDENGIFGTLSFSRTPHSCNIPWEAIFALVGDEGRGMVWPESMPPEIVAEVERENERAALSRVGREDQVKKNKGILPWPSKSGTPDVVALGVGAKTDSKKSKATPKTPKPKKALPPYLRVVK